MTRSARIVVLSASLLLAPSLAGCAGTVVEAANEPPVSLEEIAGSDVKKVTFTEDAATAVGIKSSPVTAGSAAGQRRMPYSAVLYYTDGTTCAYVVTDERTFQRVPITVASVSGQVATLSAGPPVGTPVVVVGAPEVLGAELEIDGEQ